MNNCGNCGWARVGERGLECHRRSPTLITIATRDGITRLTEWPPVKPGQDCGDHSEKEESWMAK